MRRGAARPEVAQLELARRYEVEQVVVDRQPLARYVGVDGGEDGAEEGQISMMSGLTRMSLAGSPSKNAPVAVTSPRKKQEWAWRCL